MSLIKWKTSHWSLEIKRTEVERETEVSVFMKTKHGERREAKRSSYCAYHDSWSAAREHLMERTLGYQREAESRLKSAAEGIRYLDSLDEPK